MTDQQGTLKSFDPEFVFANPYQHHSARRFRGEEFDALVEDIRVNGVHQPPPARPHPEVSGAVQLQMGHRRFAAWRIARPGEPFTVIVKPLTDLEMLEGVIEENIHRTDLNDIERAQMIETYKQVRPDATNADMARVFRLKDPASITNIRKLLQLPAAIQTHVAEDKLPDAIARQLVGVSKVNPKAAQKIADAVANAPKSEKQDVFEQNVRDIYWKSMVRLGNWSQDWLADAPITVERDLGDGDHIIGACAGCVFHVGDDHCARPACAEEKQKLYSAMEVQRIAEKTKIAAAAPNEKTFELFKGNYGDDARARDLLNARKEIRAVLRIAPDENNGHSYNSVGRMIGSDAVTLVTTDKNAIDNYFAERDTAAKAPARALSVDKDEESDAEKAKRIAQEKKEMEAKRAARSAQWKSKYDAIWLVQNAATFIAPQLEIRGDFLKFVEAVFCKEFRASHGGIEISALAEQMKKAIQNAPDEIKEEELRKRRIVFNVICDSNILNDSGNMPDFQKAHKRIESLLELKATGYDKSLQGFGVELPARWDVPPVHKTAFNCWHCGIFAGNMQEKLTQRDINEDGWIDNGKAGVFCSLEHKDAYLAAQATGDNNAQTKSKTKKSQSKAKPAKAHRIASDSRKRK